MAVDKLPQVLKEKWWFYVDDKDADRLDLNMYEKWLSRMAFVSEKVFSIQQIAQRRITIKHKQRQTILENIEFQCNFERERNQANAKRSLPNALIKFGTAHYSGT